MRILFFLLYLFICCILPAHARTTRSSNRLAALLTAMQRGQEITPDCFYVHVDLLRNEIGQNNDSVSKAVYSATLAHLLSVNAYRAQTSSRNTKSHPDSIREWSRTEYFQHAATLYGNALKSPELLFREPTKNWIPIIEESSAKNGLDTDMYIVIWQAAINDIPSNFRSGSKIPTYAQMADFYTSKGIRQNALFLMLDSLGRDGITEKDSSALRRLQAEYATQEVCAEIYLRLAQLPGKTPTEKYSLLHEGLNKYPRYWRRNALQNALAELSHPLFQWQINGTQYPNSKVKTPATVRNLSSARFTLYRLPSQFDRNQANILQAIRQEGGKIHSFKHRFSATSSLEEVIDTICWTVPGYGHYALVTEGETSARLCEKPEPQISFFRVSSIGCFSLGFPNGILRHVVVDALSGEPKRGVSAHYLQETKGSVQLLCQQTSDERGIVDIDINKLPRQNVRLQLRLNEDSFLTAQPVHTFLTPQSESVRTIRNKRIFTDRAVYRPGQKVYVAVLAYDTKGRKANASPAQDITVTYYDANHQQITEHTLTTDSFGMAVDSLLLSTALLPGNFRISVRGGTSCTFRVEEYKRPTFQILMDKPSALTWPADSIVITGTATTYSGIPLPNARVSGTYQWNNGIWRMSLYNSFNPALPFDSVYTDSDGRFSISLPIEKGQDELYRWGRRLQVHVDVLSTYGETQQSTLSLPLCSSPLRLSLSIPRLQERNNLSPWNFRLVGPTDQPVSGNIEIALRNKNGETVYQTQMPSGTATIPKGLKHLPSGDYLLYARTQIGTDTASCTVPFVLFGIQDQQLPTDTTLWVYCPRDTFSAQHPSTVQVGSSLRNAYVYCTFVTKNGIETDTLLRLSNEARLLTFPYNERYGDGAQLHFNLYNEGIHHHSSLTLHAQLPLQRLSAHWRTFRNLLHPGQKEEWDLTLLRPDGTPAQANLMCTLYDAALDAIASHRLELPLYQGHRIPQISVNTWNAYPHFYSIPFCLWQHKAPSFSPTTWNPAYFSPTDIPRNGFYTKATGAMPLASVRSAETASMRSITAQSTSSEEKYSQDSAIPSPNEHTEQASSTDIRSQHSELAFFQPCLRTDDNGNVKISFTLPQGLTSWRLLGLAYTKDMYTTVLDDTIVARKELMARLHLPRYLRSGDEAILTATLQNLSATEQRGNATLRITDAQTQKILHNTKVAFALQAMADTTLSLPFTAPQASELLIVEWVAQGTNITDGEQHPLPVLSEKQSITETQSFCIDSPQRWNTRLNKLFASDNPQATERALTVEYAARPEWFALQALPSLSTTERVDALSQVSACYATFMARIIAQKLPSLRHAVAEWSSSPHTATLTDNATLTNLLAQEMPWMAEAQNELLRHSRLESLLADAYSPSVLAQQMRRLSALQQPDGSYAWYPGMVGNVHITTEVLRQLARLQALDSTKENPEATQIRNEIILDGIRFLHRSLERKAKHQQPDIKSLLNFLYIIGTSRVQLPDAIDSDVQEWLRILEKKANTMQREQRAMAATILHCTGKKRAAQDLMPQLRRIIAQPDGFYLAYPGGSSVQPHQKIHNHILVMEAFAQVQQEDTIAMQGLQQWLLLQKRTQDWGQTVTTADAIHALTLHSQGQLTDVSTDKVVLIDKNGRHTLGSPDTHLGYLRQRLEASHPQTLQVEKHTPGISWGAVYANYCMPVTQIQAQHENINIRREVAATSKVGERLHIRYTITVNQDLEYVALSAPRPAAAEPATPLSGHIRWGNLSAYRAVHDARTDYFFDTLPRGTYVIEEDWLITHAGTYQTGAATIRCVYAPEFQAHSNGNLIKIHNIQ